MEFMQQVSEYYLQIERSFFHCFHERRLLVNTLSRSHG